MLVQVRYKYRLRLFELVLAHSRVDAASLGLPVVDGPWPERRALDAPTVGVTSAIA